MKRLIGVILTGTMALSLVTGCSPATVEPSATATATQKAEARPQDDYYRFINEPRLKDAKFDYGSGTAGSAFDTKLIDKQIETVIKDVVKGSGYEAGSEEDLIKKAYTAFLSYDFSKEPIPKDLASVLDEVQNAKTVDELLKLDAKLYKDFSVVSILNLVADVNCFEADEKILSFENYRNICGVEFGDIRDQYNALNPIVTDISSIMQTRGCDVETAGSYGKQLANLVLKIYGSTDMEIYDKIDDLNKMTILSKEEMDKVLTNVNLTEYLKALGFDEKYCEKFGVYDKSQLASINSILTDKNLDALKAWRLYDIYDRYMRLIAPHYKELAGYVKDSYDTPEQQAINEIKKVFTGETDPIYVERYYSKKTDEALRSMCDDIKEGYRKLITNAKWLSEPTRNGLLKKLENIVYVTASDLKRHDNSKYAGISGNYYEIMSKYTRIMSADIIAEMSKPKDRKGVRMAMQTMNACYSPIMNNITITAAITNAPFFDANAGYYTNLGGLGTVIAHEMGHAFDSNNIVYDQDSVYNPKWIPDEDTKVLNERNEKAVSYFENNFTVFKIHHVDGEKTLGENYADLGGMECVTSLAKNKEDLIKIFENYAVIWGMKVVDTSVIWQLAYDEHSPSVIRVNAILSALNCFYEAYDVKEGDGMYIAPEKRISRWY